jgi:integrase/recombinase XerD
VSALPCEGGTVPSLGESSGVRSESRNDFRDAALQVIKTKKSVHTRGAYARDLEGWLAFCLHMRIDPKTPGLADATLYRDSLIGSEVTRRRRLASMSTIYSTLCKLSDAYGRSIASANPFHPNVLCWPRAGRVLKARSISGVQAAAIVQASAGSARDYALLCLLCDTGWRRNAVVALPLLNYDGRCVVNCPKGNKEQEVELPDTTIAAIEGWLAERRTSDYLFPADDGDGHMHPNTVNKITDHWSKEIAPEAHPQSFRALFLRDAHEAGMPSYEIQGAAGPSSANMTSRYERKTRVTRAVLISSDDLLITPAAEITSMEARDREAADKLGEVT